MENTIDSKLRFLVKDIIAKKELGNLGEDLVLQKVKHYLKTNKKIAKKLEESEYNKFRRSKKHKEIIKNIRAGLREVYGVFIMPGYGKKYKFLEQLGEHPSKENHDRILALHKSSKERLPYYPLVYKKIFEITGLPKKIVDFACGLNPFSYPYFSELGCEPEYLASDLAEKDLEFINDYFKLMKIRGKTKQANMVADDISEITKPGDLVFLFKTLDSLESAERNVSERIVKGINAKQVVVSFSTKSLGGKKTIKKERRAWFEKLIKKLNYKFNSFEIPDEIFYIISK